MARRILWWDYNKGGRMKKELKILEACLFMSPDPIGILKLVRILGLKKQEVLKYLKELKEHYEKLDNSLKIIYNEDTAYMTIKDEFVDCVKKIDVVPQFTKPQMKILGLVAAKGEIKQSEIVRIVGNRSYDYLKELEDLELIKREKNGHTKIVKKGKKFDIYFS